MIRIDKRVRSLEEISKNLLEFKTVNSLQDEQILSHHIEISITDILTVRPGQNVWGGQGFVVFAIKRSIKNKEKSNYILALDGRHSKYNQATTNQKYASAFDNGTKEWYKWDGMQGGLLCIVRWQLRGNALSLLIIFFLRQFTYLTKNLQQRPRPAHHEDGTARISALHNSHAAGSSKRLHHGCEGFGCSTSFFFK
jgi:hypothetical protein